MSQEVLRETQLIARCLRDGELDFVPVGRKRRDDLWRRRRRRQNRSRNSGKIGSCRRSREHSILRRNGFWRGELSDQGRNVRLRVDPRHQFFDLAPAPALGGRKDLAVVVTGQVAADEADGREVQRAIAEHFEDDRELPRGAGGFDPAVGGVFGKAKHFPAIFEHGPEACSTVQAALFDLGEMGDEFGRDVALARGESLGLVEEVTIGEAGDSGEDVGLHTSLYHDVFDRSGKTVERSKQPGPSQLIRLAEW